MSGEVSVAIFEDEEEPAYDPTVSFRCPVMLLKRLDEIAKERGTTRSKVMVRLLEVGAEAYDQEKEETRKHGKKGH